MFLQVATGNMTKQASIEHSITWKTYEHPISKTQTSLIVKVELPPSKWGTVLDVTWEVLAPKMTEAGSCPINNNLRQQLTHRHCTKQWLELGWTPCHTNLYTSSPPYGTWFSSHTAEKIQVFIVARWQMLPLWWVPKQSPYTPLSQYP